MRPPSPSIPERDFVLSALSQGLRVDGRQLLEQREPTITFGPELGWVECSLGKTRVVAVVDAAMIKPSNDRPFEGIVSIVSEISPMASSEYEAGRASENEVIITRMLDKVIRRSDVIDKESLCILAGQRVWHIRLTLHFLSDSGNLLDCAALAAMAALKHFRRPDVEVIGDEVTVHSPDERAPVPLSLHHTPLVLSFAYFLPPPPAPPDNPPILLLDPTTLEAALSSGSMSVAVNSQRELCVVQKAGGVALDVEEVMRVVELAGTKVKELSSWLEGRLEEDWKGRKVEVR
ncbi:ribosomal protein S5 domain 2-like protein [Sistotremastrum niveocremeum HHB9708]|uniref:Exosome complex component RRP45 n=2 Tax=Sistotremastraceae TaxID=3402574 RepID=A0A164P9E3_9AGAM|nr:ribosomal protein S5 domain 2-like protein [Sistotremastrum niveocremeum HHB9708]KZT33488.1 ribosomal protein S5 domain 2-like protein [Sistotremastrum suecicum HHB10207 ss-3]